MGCDEDGNTDAHPHEYSLVNKELLISLPTLTISSVTNKTTAENMFSG